MQEENDKALTDIYDIIFNIYYLINSEQGFDLVDSILVSGDRKAKLIVELFKKLDCFT